MLLWLLIPDVHASPLLVTNGQADDPRVVQLLRSSIVHGSEGGGAASDNDARSESKAPVISVGAFSDLFDVVSLVGRTGDEDCGGIVSLDDWRADLSRGRSQTTTLQTSRALSTFASAELETACLDRPPAATDLVQLQLALADLHRQLAQLADEPQQRGSHQSEADEALNRAALFGMGLAAPAGFDGELLDDFDARRGVLGAGGRHRKTDLLFVGSVASVRLNGRPVEAGVTNGVPGLNLLQAVENGSVTASMHLRLSPGSSTLVWVNPGGEARTSEDVVLALGQLARGGVDDGILAGGAQLVNGGETRFAAVREDGVDLYEVRGPILVRVQEVDARERKAVRDWRGAVSAGPLVRYTQRPGVSDQPSGLAAGLDLSASFAVPGPLSGLVLSVAARPASTRTSLPPEDGGGSLFRASVPVAAGARWERPGRALTPALGAQLGVEMLGVPFPPSVYGAAVLGLAGGIGRAGGLRAEARVGAGTGLLFGDLTIATELRF
ncbi:MAG: hypothetical protein EXR69_14610 [Myxococcales bacterium]|nr:hypothetical protein [Myxococcales bacterium]